MTSSKYLSALLGFSVLTACIDVPDVVEPPDAGEHPPDSGTPPIRLQLAGGATHVRDTVTIRIETDGEAAFQVELLLDGAHLANVTAPSDFSWDTSAHMEGQHTLTARTSRSGENWTSAPLLVTVDRTPPSIAHREPAAGAENVTVAHPIRVEFSEAIDPESIAGAHVELLVNGTSVARTVSLSESQTTLEIHADAALTLPRQVEVVLSEVRDLAGNLLTTASSQWTWNVPAWIAVGPRDGLLMEEGAATLSRLALSQHHPQTAAVAFRVAEGVGVLHWTGESWARLGPVLTPARTAADIQFSSDGEPAIAFSDYYVHLNEEEVQVTLAETYIHQWRGRSWERIAVTSRDWDNSWPLGWNLQREAPSFALGATGAPWLAQGNAEYWGFGCQGDIQLAIETQIDGEWLHVDNPSRGDPEQCGVISTPSMVLGASQLPIVAWTEATHAGGTPNNDARIFVKQRTAAGWKALGNAIKHHPSGTSATQPVLRLSSANVPVLAWKESNPAGSGTTATDIHVRRWENLEWKPLGGRISATSGETPAESPSLALHNDGTPVLAWVEGSGTGKRVHVRQWNGEDWVTLDGAPSDIPESTGAAQVSLQLDKAGTPWVAWDGSRDGTPARIFVYRFNR
ncbi:Ig-like domain-containing protein [Myxococcus sp. Y35]|uniref:Ig-like domain-containing protein n=1 Tax=Pseudomyxococcus flavus TaxID=3115648 RepID=UPI003CED242A